MKNKGFTLVELLAVIVILAIIALIAIPIILGIIEDVRKKTAKSSAQGYIEAVEKASLILSVSNGTSFKNGEYEVDGENLIQNDVVIYTIDYKGDEATGALKINNGEVTEAELTFKSIINKKVKLLNNALTIDDNDKPIVDNEDGDKESTDDTNKEPEVVYGVTRELPTNNETYKAIVYLDPTNLEIECNASNAVSTTGTKTGCMKWYAFAETDTTYDLILDHNSTPLVPWNTSNSNGAMNQAKTALESDTAGWIGNPRLITAYEIAVLTGAKDALDWQLNRKFVDKNPTKGTNISWFYYDGSKSNDPIWHTQISWSSGASIYSWLYDNLNGCMGNGCNKEDNNYYNYWNNGNRGILNGYWTSSSTYGTSNSVWVVGRDGRLFPAGVAPNDYGIRPVITIEKIIFE